MNALQFRGPLLSLLSVSIFTLSSTLPAQMVGGAWSEINLSGPEAGMRFGSAVAAAGDVDGDGFADLIVGAYSASPGGQLYAGSVLVHSGVDGSLLHRFDGALAGDYFGRAVSGAGDVNGDGFDDLLIGAPGVDVGMEEAAGAAYVFSGLDGSLLQQFLGAKYHDRLGTAVSAAGDLNLDGRGDFMISAPLANPSDLESAGSVYVYSGIDFSLLQQFDGSAVNEQLGTGLAPLGDVDLDGRNDFLIASSEADGNGWHLGGRAQIYSGFDYSLIHQIEGDEEGQRLAWSAAGAGDVDGDGYADFILGAPYADAPGALFGGMSRVYSGATGAQLFQIDGQVRDDNLGMSVAGGPDFNDDGLSDFIIGVSRADASSGMDAGNVLVLSGADASVLRLYEGTFNSNLGYAIAVLGDTDGNGLDDFAMGAWKGNESGKNQAGFVDVIAYTQCLSTSDSGIPSSAGGSVDFWINFPPYEAGQFYYLLGSATGTGPIVSGNVEIPLTVDWFFHMLTATTPPTQFTDLTGVLDSNGDATATLTLLPDEASIYVGTTFYYAAVSYEPIARVRLASVPVTVSIDP